MAPLTREHMVKVTAALVEEHAALKAASWELLLQACASLAEPVGDGQFRPILLDVHGGRLVVSDELAPLHPVPRSRPGLSRVC